MDKEIMSPRDLATYLGVSISTLAKKRHKGGHIPYVKEGRKVLYRKKVVDQYLWERERDRV